MEITQVLRKPVITEKTTRLRENNQYVIDVHPKASKSQVREAIEKQFKVNIVQIRTVKAKGKYRRRIGPHGGYQPDRKKAIVRLKAGQQITWEEVA